MNPTAAAFPDRRRLLLLSGWVIGFALGGFLDGILLHQVLQWHHLLSLVPGEALRDIRAQILADGLFHVAMYVIAAAGLWMMWRGRAGFTGAGVDRLFLANTALGFSLWQFVDTVLFHWILGIHRIRVDVDNPLAWDIGWLLVFGVTSLILGIGLRRSARGDGGGGGLRRAPAAVAVAAALAGPVAALPPPGSTTMLVLFGSGVTPAQAFAAVGEAEGRVVWAHESGQLLAVDLGADGRVLPLYRGGALMASSSSLLAGCLAWARL